MIKLKSILIEMSADLPPPDQAEVRFVMPGKQSSKNSVYTNPSADFSPKPSISSSSGNPTFEDYKNHFIKYEGKKNKPYTDSRGFPTVGIGHKFEKGESRKSNYTDAEVDNFFKKDLAEAIAATKKVFPNFDALPKEVKIKLVSLTFNLGEGGIKKFTGFRSAISKKDWDSAANELVDSRWYKQAKNRSKDYVEFFKSLA